MSDWVQPEVGPDDRLVEAAVVLEDGTELPIVVLVRRTETGWSASGYSRPIDLPPGASIAVPIPEEWT